MEVVMPEERVSWFNDEPRLGRYNAMAEMRQVLNAGLHLHPSQWFSCVNLSYDYDESWGRVMLEELQDTVDIIHGFIIGHFAEPQAVEETRLIATESPPVRTADAMGCASGLTFPDPLDYRWVDLEDRYPDGEIIGYTDCMECSMLRFVQVMLCDTQTLSSDGVPTHVDLDIVGKIVNDTAVMHYFQQNTRILPAVDYNDEDSAIEARQAWARLVTRKPLFNYKRASNGVWKNHAIGGMGEIPPEATWVFELEPCLHNVLCMFRSFLGVDFSRADHKLSALWSKDIERNKQDVSREVQHHFDLAARKLSRPGFELQFHVKTSEVVEKYGGSWWEAMICIAVNGRGAWCWHLYRRSFGENDFGDTETARRMMADANKDNDGKPAYYTSWHSEIYNYSELHYGVWDWIL
eukprot:TRINITY_DN83669_c0_g1_i1.p1 TRINITY_DN83669_c0_g1~~TRINITY_DN83669_c0_g1_i1.p1  ORF type:complete len:430 (-),score=68.75 TRINITY_DN83669_c0_g1_i1:186-1406(-)